MFSPPPSDVLEEIWTKLIRLIYVSKAVDPQSRTLTDSILRQAHAWNAQNDICGVLCEGQGVFLQVLEGERGAVTRLLCTHLCRPASQGVGVDPLREHHRAALW